jgi:hypothetical protein
MGSFSGISLAEYSEEDYGPRSVVPMIMMIKEIGFEIVDWIILDEDWNPWQVLAKTMKNLRVP